MYIDSDTIPLAVAPKAASVAAAGTLVTGWVDVSLYTSIAAVVGVGSGAGTPALTWEQANTSGGGAAKALAWNEGTFDTNSIEVSNRCVGLDVGFRWVRATATVTGGAGTVVSINLLGLEPRYQP